MSIVSHLPLPNGPKILVANHPTTSDPFILTSISNGQSAVLIKNILFDIPLFGTYLHWAGHIPVRVGEGQMAFEKALTLLKNGITIIVFIEGDLSKLGIKKKNPKTGAVRLAISSGIPIIPIGIGIKKKNIKTFKSVIKGIKEWGKWYLKGPYALTIGKPLNIYGTLENRERIKKLSGWLTEKIFKLQEESIKRLK